MNGLCAHSEGGHIPASERLGENVLLAMDPEFAFDQTGRAEVRRLGSP